MGRGSRVVTALLVTFVAASLVPLGATGGAGSAGAQEVPVLDPSDLPAGYAVTPGSPLVRTNVPPSAPTLTRCTWGTPTRVAGPFPVITSSGFVRPSSPTAPAGTVQETVWQFPRARAARRFATRLIDTYTAASKCPPLREPAPGPGSEGPVDAGRFTRLPLDRVGNASFAVTYSPTAGESTTRIVLFRTGTSVGTLTVADPTLDPAAFTALVRRATVRA
jgi:hypothetical protein